MREMRKNHSSIVVLRIRPKFWSMLPMGVRENYTKYEPETQVWRSGTGVTRGGPPFQNLWKWPKIGSFGAAWVPRMSMEGSNCITTNMDDEETLLIPV